MRISFVFSLIFKNRTFFPHSSILTKNVFLVTLKAKYQNDPNKVKKCHMFQVTEIFLPHGIIKYFLTPTKKHTVYLISIIIYLNASALFNTISTLQYKYYIMLYIETITMRRQDIFSIIWLLFQGRGGLGENGKCPNLLRM